MQVLIVVAHPKADSLTQALAAEFARGLTQVGHEYRLLDLYAEGFDPVLKAAEIAGPGPGLADDVRRMQALLAASGGLALLFPVWWGSPPAILAGWLQRVLTLGFAFERVGGILRGLLRHRAQLIINTGGPVTADPAAGLVEALEFCGMQPVRSLVNPGIGAGTDPRLIEAALAKAFEAGRGF
jgi:NAD(P)H dehydrogenase (quinone)